VALLGGRGEGVVVGGLLEVEVIYDATLTLFNMLILFILVGGGGKCFCF
jgi:hypothetical protein